MTQKLHLLSPGRIGTLELRNRVIVSSMGVGLAEPDGTCGDRIIAFSEARARGGAGLVNIGAVGVANPEGMIMRNQVAVSDDLFIPGLARLAKAVQSHGARIALQLQHGGPSSNEAMVAGYPLWVPSVPPRSDSILESLLLDEERSESVYGRMSTAPTFRVMDKGDIESVIEQFVSAARRAQMAGMDGVELHAAHGYLLRSFLSPATNSRSDEYGGSVENRARFLIETISAIRKDLGTGFPVWCKINAIEFNFANGFTVEDACTVARMAEEAGADAISASSFSGSGRGRGLVSGSAPMRPANYVSYAAQVRKAVRIPVITAGRIEIDVAEGLLSEGKVDFIAMGRKMLAEPELVARLAEGKPEEVRPCIYCYTCISDVTLDRPIRCAVNGVTGRESIVEFPKSTKGRRVVVVGGGPGGMEAARLLDRMGHKVTLVEASRELGGTARLAAIAYEPNGRIVQWLKQQLHNSSVEVRVGATATPESVAALSPDAVVVATGAVRTRPDIRGASQPHVYDGSVLRQWFIADRAGSATDANLSLSSRLLLNVARKLQLTRYPDLIRRASRLWMPFARDVVIIGGDLVGLELAEFLAHRGRNVTVIDEVERLGTGLALMRRGSVLDELATAGVMLIPSAFEIEIDGALVRCRDGDGSERSIPAGNVILAQGARGDLSLAQALQEAGLEVHVVGDCKGVGYIAEAMKDAADVAAAFADGRSEM